MEEIIEHHVEEEEEDKEERRRSQAPSFLESLAGSSGTHSNTPGSTQSSHRLLAYSDALISIIATVMILPVAHTKIGDNEELKESVQVLLTTKIGVYLMTFLIVTVAWAAHVRLFQVIVRIDDCLALLNLFSLMATFPENHLGILLFCGCVMVIGLMQALVVVYAFSRPFLLNEQIQSSEDQKVYKHHILQVILKVPIMCFLASIFSFIFLQLSYVLLAIVIFLPYISQFLKWCRSKAIGQEEPPDSALLYRPSEPLSKERVEAFSDGVYAIDNVPDRETVRTVYNGSLVSALRDYGPEYLAYFGSFVTVGLLWFVHHSLFLHVTKTTRFMGLLNTFSLAFVGGLPLAYQLTHEFPRNSHNELEAIQVSCVIIFFAGINQLGIWVVALYNEQETLHPYVHYAGREHIFMLAKLALYPCVALGTFFLTCVLSKFSAPIFHLMEIAVPLAFVVLRLLVRAALAVLRLVLCPERANPRTVVEEEDALVI
ncbi:Endosomal/lysosomal potassium channel TMEM175 [Merluccius polli]|uniref:Endosomal/lysosomal proton channel TMEM175 n=1 Tax=Merluccius polli TaxID=89951 RepID=A0AA47PDA6_MERPO|nr:Endosomal/lysosomal potassium channel TMEM175 [Merluccius polli]